MRQVTQMGMSLDGYVASDREHPGVTYLETASYWPRADCTRRR
jgi:hypothetical protein